MSKIAIRSNNDELSKKVIEKLESKNIIPVGKMHPNQLRYMCYIPDKDIIVSPLCLEMWYPEYKEVYATDYLREETT